MMKQIDCCSHSSIKKLLHNNTQTTVMCITDKSQITHEEPMGPPMGPHLAYPNSIQPWLWVPPSLGLLFPGTATARPIS